MPLLRVWQRPIKRFCLYLKVQIEGHQQQAHVHSALVKIAKKVLKVDILGSYPVTVL
jgi:prephenate dehydratase